MLNRKAALAFGLLAAMAISVSARAQDNANTMMRTIPLSGVGIIEAKPEFASVKITVTSQTETVDKAWTANKEAIDKVLAKIATLSLPQADVQIGIPQISQGYTSKKSVISSASETAFTASTTIEILVRDLPNSSRILASLFTLEDVQVHSLSWKVADTVTPMDKARIAAVVDARRRADIYAQAAGAKIGRILAIQETTQQDMAQEGRDDRYIRTAPNQPLTPPSTVTFRTIVNTVWSIE